MIHLFYGLAPSARQDRALRHFLRVQKETYRWLKNELATYPQIKGRVLALGKAFTAHKKTVPDWGTVYSTPIRSLIYSCFYEGRDFNPNSIYFPSAAGWKLGTDIIVSKVVSTIKIAERPHVRSYGPITNLASIGTPATLKLILSPTDEWHANVGVNTGDRIIAISTWNGECGHGCDDMLSEGDLVEKVDVGDHHEIDEPILQWCHLDCLCPRCGVVYPACDCAWDEPEEDEFEDDETEDGDLEHV